MEQFQKKQNILLAYCMTESMKIFVFQMDEYMIKHNLKLFRCLKHEQTQVD